MSLFCCPLCAAPLEKTDRTYRCPRGHSFDRAREGYVHLLPANRMHSKAPGDDKAMAAARNRFLSGGWYAPLRDALCRLAVDHAPARRPCWTRAAGRGITPPGCGRPWRRRGNRRRRRAWTCPSPPSAGRPGGSRGRSSPWPPSTICRWRRRGWTSCSTAFRPWPWRSFGGCCGPAGCSSMWSRRPAPLGAQAGPL